MQNILNRTSQEIVRQSASHSSTRRLLNRFYSSLSLPAKARYHSRFAKIFRGPARPAVGGEWRVSFQGKEIRLPLTRSRMWLDWDLALSILAHDPEVKAVYARVIDSATPPEMFVDIGANYGTHSALFLAHHIRTITFEPNPECHVVFREICDLNGLRYDLRECAVGDREGEVELRYPDTETWLGSVGTSTEDEAAGSSDVRTTRVHLQTVDSHLDEMVGRRVLIKIDTEGNECAVLRGARRTLNEVRPHLVFETWKGPHREELFQLLHSSRYEIAPLCWPAREKLAPLTSAQFIECDWSNYLAIPAEDRQSSVRQSPCEVASASGT